MRSPAPALLLALALAGCASAVAPDGGETRVIAADDLTADRIVGEAAVCGYPGVRKALGGGDAATVTIVVPAKADPRYQCLVEAMAARGEDQPKPKPFSPP